MSLMSDLGDLNKDYGLRIHVAAKNCATSMKLYENRIFGPNLGKMEKMVTNQESKFDLSSIRGLTKKLR